MVKKEDAVNYLRDLSPETSFWVNNSNVLKNLDELQNALETMTEETYRYHVNKEKNDFSKWVDEVIGDKKLAKDLQSARNRYSALVKVKRRVETLRNAL